MISRETLERIYQHVDEDCGGQDRVFMNYLLADHEVLTKALALAVGELSTYGSHADKSPVDLYDQIIKEAQGG